MKAAVSRTVLTVDFGRKRAPRPTVAPTGRIPRVARLLALAHKIDTMIKARELRDLADAARAAGLTRARITQIMNLLMLAPAIQEAILNLPPLTNGRERITERQLRRIVAEPHWERQMAAWRKIDE